MEEGVCISLEVGQILEKEKHARMKAKEEACIIEEERLKSEESDLFLKSEDKARLVEEAGLKSDQKEQAIL